MKDFFISYNNADRNWAEWIAWQLEEAGYTTIIQDWDSRPGKNFVLWMQESTSHSNRTIAVLSQAYLDAAFTQSEWIAAFRQDPKGEKGKLLPIRVEACDLTGLLPAISYIDLVGLEETVAKETLLTGVKQERIKPTIKPGFPGTIKHTITDQPVYPGFKSKSLNETHTLYGDEEIVSSNKQNNKNLSMKLITPGKDKIKILFIGIQQLNGPGIPQIDLKGELKKINEAIRKSKFSSRVMFYDVFDIRAIELLKVLREYSPTILHLSGHGVVFPFSEKGGIRILEEVDLVSILREFINDLKLVILNGDETSSYAKSLTKFIDFTIGTKGGITDWGAVAFCEEFYYALCSGRSIESAFNLGRVASRLTISKENYDIKIDRYNINDYELRWRKGIDPSSVVLFKSEHVSKFKTALKKFVH